MGHELVNSNRDIHTLSDIICEFEESLKRNLELPADKDIHEQLMAGLTSETFLELLKDRCPELLVISPAGNRKTEVYLSFPARLYSVAERTGRTDLPVKSDAVESARSSILEREKYEFTGDFSEQVIQDHSPPEDLLSLVSKLLYGKVILPYTGTVQLIAAQIVYSHQKNHSNVSDLFSTSQTSRRPAFNSSCHCTCVTIYKISKYCPNTS